MGLTHPNNTNDTHTMAEPTTTTAAVGATIASAGIAGMVIDLGNYDPLAVFAGLLICGVFGSFSLHVFGAQSVSVRLAALQIFVGGMLGTLFGLTAAEYLKAQSIFYVGTLCAVCGSACHPLMKIATRQLVKRIGGDTHDA